MTEFNGSKGFLYIPVGIAHDKELLKQPKRILLMGEIISMLNVTGKFYMSNKALAEKLGCKRRSVQNYLTYLEEHGYIKRTTVYEDGDTSHIKGRLISAGPTLRQAFNRGWGATDCIPPCNTLHEGGATDCIPPVQHIAPKENSIREQYKRTEEVVSDKSDEEAAKNKIEPETRKAARKIIPYLNKKTGSNRRPSTDSYLKLIQPLLHKKYTVDDFYTVIDYKCKEWLDSPKTAAWLRPSTLFAPRHFDDYLNQARIDKRVAKQNGTDKSFDEMAKATEEAARKAKKFDDTLPF